MTTATFLVALKKLSNNRAAIEFDARHVSYRFIPVAFWPGFEADVRRLREEHGIESRAYDLWVEGAIERQLHVEWNPERDLTPEEVEDFQRFDRVVRDNWRTIQDRRTAEHNRLCG